MVHELLHRGMENALTKEALCSMLEMSERGFRKQVERERKNGVLIISDSQHGGYFLPKNNAEIRRFLKQETHRAVNIFQALKPFRDEIKQEKKEMKLQKFDAAIEYLRAGFYEES